MADQERASSPGVTKVNIDDVLDGKYRIVRSLGRGAWGHVYEGVNDRIGRRLAIKILHPEYVERRDMLERFEREARTATKIESEHVVRVLDLGALKDGRPYIVMEFLDGEDLGQHLARVKILEPTKAAIVGLQALRGLVEAHAEGILHRDIKPDNIVLVKTRANDRVVKIVDFGISKLAGTAQQQASSMTATGAVLGSPMYMSPEQCRGAKRIDARSDLYSLGVVLYEAVTGRMPYDADTFNELMFKIALEDVPDPRVHRADIDPGFTAIVMRALEREPDKRFPNAEEFHDAIARWLEVKGINESDWRLGSSLSGSGTGGRASTIARAASSSSPDLTRSGGVAQTVVAPDAMTASQMTASHTPLSSTTGKPQERKSRVGVVLVGIVALLGAAGIYINQTGGKGPKGSASTKADSTETASPPPTETSPPVATTVAPPPSTAPVVSASATPEALPTPTPTPAQPFRRGVRPSPTPPAHTTPSAAAQSAAPSAQPAPVASPAPVPTPAPAPSPAASGRGVVEGRTIRTTL